ncbi:hypothetical protein FB639_003637 [Coemansia asiatica]|nr:hypothetical protein FB639_003637 [Coemansia asiatica]
MPECPSGPGAPCCKTDNSQLESAMPEPALERPRTSCCPQKPHGTASSSSSSSSSSSAVSYQANGNVNSNGHGQSDSPNCDCGCSCKQKLELLVQAIEARIGQPLNIDVDQAHSSVVGPEEWVESVLSPLSPAVSNDSNAASEPATSNSKNSTISNALDLENVDELVVAETQFSGTDVIGQFAAGVLPPAVTVPGCCGPKRQTGTGVSSSVATPKRASCCSTPKSLKSDGSDSASSKSNESNGNDISDSIAETDAAVAPCCMPTAPQQVLPEQKSCCDDGNQKGGSDGVEQKASCCGSGDDEGGCCCKKRASNQLWQPGDSENPEVDKDGALACSCGCRKPFEECTDCLEDLCEEVLLRPTF